MSLTIQVLHTPNAGSTNPLAQRVYYRVFNGEISHVEPNKVYAADVILDRPVEGHGPFVELLLIEHLVVKKKVVDSSKIGSSVNFITGCALLGQLANGGQNSGCNHPKMVQHRHMFASRFFDSTYSADTATDWIEEAFALEGEIPVEKVYSNFCNGSYIENSFVGKLVMTHHALSRYQERSGYKSMSRAWKNIVPLLETCKWTLDSSFVMDQKTNRVSETWQVKGLRRRPFLAVTTRQGRTPSHRRIVTIMSKATDSYRPDEDARL